MKFQESANAHKWLDPLEQGIEIGASAHNPFGLANRIANVDKFPVDEVTSFNSDSFRLCGEIEPVDVVASADKLPWVDASLDYVLSSHVLEHLYDPISTLEEWARVLRPGGLIYAIIPHKERTFDQVRPRTTFEELKQRWLAPAPFDLDDRHWSVWITADGVELFERLGFELLEVMDVDDKVGNGFTIVARSGH